MKHLALNHIQNKNMNTGLPSPLVYVVVFALMSLALATQAKGEERLLFLSTQLAPVAEAHKMRTIILKDYPEQVDFQPYDDRVVISRLLKTKGRNAPALVGGTHGDLVPLFKGGLLEPIAFQPDKARYIGSLVELARFDQKAPYYLPWMQGTYIMAARKEALPHLPPGADINRLSYDQFLEWSKRINQATGKPKTGFPAGQKGLMHRFFQGYLYPSFTGRMVGNFRGPEAVKMWRYFKALWQTVHPGSLGWSSMADPLLSGEVWLTWDHTARLLPALEKIPGDLVAFPAPSGPKGRGFMVVLVGLAIPRDSPNKDGAHSLITYLAKPKTQLSMLRNLGFFPVVEGLRNDQLSPGTRLAQTAIENQSGAPDALPALLPVGLGENSGLFSALYSRTFSQIILRGKSPESILDKQANDLRQLLKEAKAPCWAPDPPSRGPCPVN